MQRTHVKLVRTNEIHKVEMKNLISIDLKHIQLRARIRMHGRSRSRAGARSLAIPERPLSSTSPCSPLRPLLLSRLSNLRPS
jgi:hypothetical protein